LCVVPTAGGASPQPVMNMPEGVDIVPVDWHPAGDRLLVAL
jgi:hypothetical protein